MSGSEMNEKIDLLKMIYLVLCSEFARVIIDYYEGALIGDPWNSPSYS